MRLRAGNGPRNMTGKLLSSRDELELSGEDPLVTVDQIALSLPVEQSITETLAKLERLARLDLVVAYEPQTMRSAADIALLDSDACAHFKRLGVIRGRPGIGHPAAVHLDRCATPARVILSNSPNMCVLGGLGMLSFVASSEQLIEALCTGRVRWRTPQVFQIILSGRLSPSVSARDVTLELLRMGLGSRVASILETSRAPVVLEFSGPGMRGLSVPERALLCSMAREVGADAAIATSDEKTELHLRDQRRSKAFRQLAPDAGAPCAEVLCLDLSSVYPLVATGSGVIVAAADLANQPVREIIIGGDSAASLRDLLSAVAWFKTKRISTDVDVIVVPTTRQIFEAIAASGALSQLLSAGARLLEPDVRLLTGEWQPAASDGTSLRSFPHSGRPSDPASTWSVASLDTLCISAITGSIQDPRAARKAPRISCPRELPIDDSLLFDKKPSTSATIPPPCASVDPGSVAPSRLLSNTG